MRDAKTAPTAGAAEYMQRRQTAVASEARAAEAALRDARLQAAKSLDLSPTELTNRRAIMLAVSAWITDEIARMELLMDPPARTPRPAATSATPTLDGPPTQAEASVLTPPPWELPPSFTAPGAPPATDERPPLTLHISTPDGTTRRFATA